MEISLREGILGNGLGAALLARPAVGPVPVYGCLNELCRPSSYWPLLVRLSLPCSPFKVNV